MKLLLLLLLPFSLMAQLPEPPPPPTSNPTTFYKAMEVTYIGLNAADLALTLHILDNGGVELNPIFKKANPATMIAAKVAITGGVLLLNRLAYKHDPKMAKITLVGVNVIMGLVVANNATVTINLNKH